MSITTKQKEILEEELKNKEKNKKIFEVIIFIIFIILLPFVWQLTSLDLFIIIVYFVLAIIIDRKIERGIKEIKFKLADKVR